MTLLRSTEDTAAALIELAMQHQLVAQRAGAAELHVPFTQLVQLVPGARTTAYMAEARDFIAVPKAGVWGLQPGGRQVAAAPFLNVSRDHIELILPGD